MEGRSGGLSAIKRQIAKLRPDVVHTWLFAANPMSRRGAGGGGKAFGGG